MPIDQDRQLARLGYLLYALGILFGITAIIGALVSHSKFHRVESPLARAHLRLQLISFWLVLLLLAMTLWLWPQATARGLFAAAVVVWFATWSLGLVWLGRRAPANADDAPPAQL